MKLTLTIQMDNAAFEGEYGSVEVARILREVANRVSDPPQEFPLFDINGNKVGKVEVK